MENFFINWFLLFSVFTIGLASPGPDLVMVVRNSLLFSRKAGLFTALGFASGVMVHITYTLCGIAALIAQSVFLFSVLKYAGAAYLIYFGIKALKSKGFSEGTDTVSGAPETMSPFQAFRSGFLTNLLNPKVTLFFLAIFTQFVGPGTPILIQASYAITCVAMTGVWFSIVAIFLTHNRIRAKFLGFSRWIDKVCGTLMIILGLRLAFDVMQKGTS